MKTRTYYLEIPVTVRLAHDGSNSEYVEAQMNWAMNVVKAAFPNWNVGKAMTRETLE